MLIVLLFFMMVGLFLCLDILKPPYGVVFDIATGEYIDTAVVTLVNADTGDEVARSVSDMHGRYYFFAPPGRYTIVTERTHFQVLHTYNPLACIYGVPYHGQVINHRGGAAISYSIAMKQTAHDWNHNNKLTAQRETAGLSVIGRWIVLFVAMLVTGAAFFYLFFYSVLLLGGIGVMMLIWWGVFLFDHSPAQGIPARSENEYDNGYVEVLGYGNVVVKRVPMNPQGGYWALIPPGKYTIRSYRVDNGKPATLDREYQNVSLKSGVLTEALVEQKGVV